MTDLMTHTHAIRPSALGPDVRCVAYLRVSTEGQVGEVYTSLADQERAILARAAQMGASVGAWYRDEGFSGAYVESRPAFRDMLAACEASPRPLRSPGVVLCLNDSRFGRFPDPDEAAALRFRFKQSGWVVRFCEGDDTEDVTFRSVIRSLGSAQASEYRRNIQRNARRGHRGTAGQGFWQTRAPFGYRRQVVYPPGVDRILEDGVRKAPNEKVKLTPHEAEAEHVRWCFATFDAGGHSLSEIGRAMASRCPGRRWSKHAIRDMLKNPAYVGDVVASPRTNDGSIARLTRREARAAETYGMRDAHPALIDRVTFARVQDRLAEHRRHGRRVLGRYLMAGLFSCTYCGRSYAGGGSGSRERKVGLSQEESPTTAPGDTRIRFYKCSGSEARPESVCPGPMGTVARHLIDDAVVRTIAAVLRRPAAQAAIERALDSAISALSAPAAGATASRRRRERDLTRQRDRLVAAIASGTLTEAEAAPQLAHARSALADLARERDLAATAAARVALASTERERLLASARDFPRVVTRLQGAALRELVRPWIAGATFDKVTRIFTLDIWQIPGGVADESGVLHLSDLPGQSARVQGRRVWRRTLDLTQPGHACEAERRRAAVDADRARADAARASARPDAHGEPAPSSSVGGQP